MVFKKKITTIIINISIVLPLALGGAWYIIDQKDQTITKQELKWKSEIDQRTAENKELTQKMNTLIKEKEDLIQKMDALMRDYLEAKKETSKLKEEKLAFEIQIKNLQDKINTERSVFSGKYSDTERELDQLKSEKGARELSLANKEVILAQSKKTFDNFALNEGKSLGMLTSYNKYNETISIEEMQYALAKQNAEFTQDLELLFTAFENELNALMSGRGRKVKKVEIRTSLKNVRSIYKKLAKKYQTPIFDNRIKSLDANIFNV